MDRIQLDEDIQPLSKLKSNGTALIEHVRKTRRPLVITRHGKSAAVMLDIREYELLMEKLELLSDIQVAESQLNQGEGIVSEIAKNIVMDKFE